MAVGEHNFNSIRISIGKNVNWQRVQLSQFGQYQTGVCVRIAFTLGVTMKDNEAENGKIDS